MNEEPNPYAPPTVDPGASLAHPDSGSLWRIVDGRLQVRDRASLPDVCIYGSPEGEPGSRSSLTFNATPEFVVGIAWIAFGTALIAGWIPRELNLPMIFVVIAPMLFGKRVRLLAFRSRSATRSAGLRSLLTIVVSVALAVVALRYIAVLPWRLPPFAAIAIIFGVVRVVRFAAGKRFGWARSLKEGWFEIPGVAPVAITRLEAIQQRVEAPRRSGLR